MLISSDIKALKVILRYCQNIESYIGSISDVEFASNTEKQDAVAYNIYQLGELLGNLAEDVKCRIPNARLVSVICCGYRVLHQYDTCYSYYLWDIAMHDVPAVSKAVETCLGSMAERESAST